MYTEEIRQKYGTTVKCWSVNKIKTSPPHYVLPYFKHASSTLYAINVYPTVDQLLRHPMNSMCSDEIILRYSNNDVNYAFRCCWYTKQIIFQLFIKTVIDGPIICATCVYRVACM